MYVLCFVVRLAMSKIYSLIDFCEITSNSNKFPGGYVVGKASHATYMGFHHILAVNSSAEIADLTPVSVNADFLKIQYKTCL